MEARTGSASPSAPSFQVGAGGGGMGMGGGMAWYDDVAVVRSLGVMGEGKEYGEHCRGVGFSSAGSLSCF